MEEERKGILIAHSICPFCLIPSHCSTNSYWIKPFILQLRHMAFSLTYPCVMFICCRIKRGAQLIRLNLLLFPMHCFLSCQSQTVLNMGLNHRYSRGLATSGIWDAGRFRISASVDLDSEAPTGFRAASSWHAPAPGMQAPQDKLKFLPLASAWVGEELPRSQLVSDLVRHSGTNHSLWGRLKCQTGSYLSIREKRRMPSLR